MRRIEWLGLEADYGPDEIAFAHALRKAGARKEVEILHEIKARLGARFHVVYDHEWYWRSKLGERKGQPCRVVVRGAKNSILVEFEDGFHVVTSRHAVRQVVK